MSTCKYSVKTAVSFYGDNHENLNVSFKPCAVQWKKNKKDGEMKRSHLEQGISFVINQNTVGMKKIVGTGSTFFMPDDATLLQLVQQNPMIAKLGYALLEAQKLCVNTPCPVAVPAATPAPTPSGAVATAIVAALSGNAPVAGNTP